MKRPKSRAAILSVLILGAIIFGTVLYLWNIGTAIFQPVNSTSHTTISLTIHDNENTTEIANDLQQKGLIRNALAFRVWARIKGLDTKLQAGVYRKLSPSMTISDITDQLLNGQPDATEVVVIEGKRLEEIASELENANPKLVNFKATDFLNYVKNINQFPDAGKYPLLQQAQAEGQQSMEGLLFPSTYEVPVDYNTVQVIDMMLTEMQTLVQQNHLDTLAQQHQYKSTYDLIKLASIVERETGDPKYRGQIASVYWNRLNMSNAETAGLLGADPTVQYARDTQTPPTAYWAPLDDVGGNIAPDSPWNTYKFPGLPPTPICSPGLASLQAAANPPQTPYLYFFAAKDGNTYFAKTSAEQQQQIQQHSVNN